MFRATVNGFERFSEVDGDVEELVRGALAGAAEVAAEVAQAGSTLNLDIEIDAPAGTVDGYASGIRSRRRGKNGVRLAPIFDGGTLGEHRGKLKRRRKESWQVNRGGSSFRAQRHAIEPDEGIPAERFLVKARTAGRKALLARIDRGI